MSSDDPGPSDPISESLDAFARKTAIAYYDLAAPLIAKSFGEIPLISLFLPTGFNGDTVRVGRIIKPLPPAIPTISVTTTTATSPYMALTVDSLLWRIHTYAVGFESWTPTPADPTRAAFAHICVTQHGSATLSMQRATVRTLRTLLNDDGIDAFVALDGPGTMLWIPFADAPLYPDVRLWAHALVSRAIAAQPDLFETGPNEPPNRFRVSVSSNAPGRGVGLPYTLRLRPYLPLNLPITWDELDTLAWDAYDAETAHERLARGDVLAREIARIGTQSFAKLDRPTIAIPFELAPQRMSPAPRSEVITLALTILADGKPRSVEEIEAEAIAKDLWPKNERRKYVYATLKAYVERCAARSEKPLIVQDADRRFRLNRTADDLPNPKPDVPYVVPQKLIDALRTTGTGIDTDAFELAVLAALEHLGFATQHLGGTMNPDGYADARLGPLGYRLMVECKSGVEPLVRPDVFEAGKFRETYHAQYCMMIAPAYGGARETIDEAANHGVALWTVDDLATLLTIDANAYEIRAFCDPGLIADRVADLMWSRDHGPRKRLTVICDAICEAGWHAQSAAADFHSPADAPLLTEDAAMLLVDEWLECHDSHTPCSRVDVRAAFNYLTSQRVGKAIWLSESNTAIIIVKA